MIPITVVPPGPMDRSILDIPGAFLWWYVDLVDEAGRGLVLIASFGLPFLPGLLDAARRGAPAVPRSRPALSLAVYGGSRFYLLDVPSDATWESTRDGERLRFGRTTLTLAWDGDDFTLDAAIDAEGAGERVIGRVTVTGRSRPSEAAVPVHGWSVLAGGATGIADLRFDGEDLRINGRAYVDRNAGTRPLDQLMPAWTWARVAFPGGDLVLWDLDPPLVLWTGTDGSRREIPASLMRIGNQWAGGVVAPRQIEVHGEVEATLTLGAPHESSPFYARFPVTAIDADGRIGHGFAERCRPDRIDQAWMRPLVRMCVQEPAQRSMWLPLFAGPGTGRVRRLLRSWVTS